MTLDTRLTEIIRQLEEKGKKLKEISKELKSKTSNRSEEEIQSDLSILLDEMTALHDKANGIIKS